MNRSILIVICDFLLINLLTLVGYILPWLVAAYYLMKAREIAA